MALQHLRSSTANKRPLPANMADGQVAVNTNTSSPGLFVKDSAAGLLKIGPTHIGTTAPNLSPAAGGATGNTVGEQWLDTTGANPLLKVWDGSAWRTVQPVTTGTVVSTTDVGTITSTMILDETIANVDISTTASIAHSKLASITAGNILLGNASNVPTATTVSGDVTITSAGVTTVSNGAITNAKVSASAGIVDTKLATISTAGKVSNSATTATNGNTANAIVARDANGNFSAGTISASLNGNASTATNASTVTTNANLTGDVTSVGNATSIAAGVIVNADISASAAIADTKLATISTAGKVSNSATTATNGNTVNTIVARDASGNFSAGTISAALNGNASTATTLQNTRTINGTNFNGSANITTSNWGTARTITIGNTGKSVNGSGNVSWSSSEIVNRTSTPADTYVSWGDGVHLADTSYPTGTGSVVASFVFSSNRGIQLATSSFSEGTPLQFRRIHTNQTNGLGAWQSLVDETSTQTIGGTKTFSDAVTFSSTVTASSFTATNGNSILRSVDNSDLRIFGGSSTSTGGNILLNGGSHSTVPNRILIRQGTATRIELATAGAIALTAGGTNQNITLTPSGTGTVNAPTFNATSTTAGGFQGISGDTVATPSFTWTGDLTTGIYRSSTNEVGITGGGVVRARFGGNVFFFKNTFVLPVDDPAADATTTTRNSATLNWRGKYWNGTASVNTDWNTIYVPSDTAGNGQWRLRNGSTNRLTVDNSGTVTATTFAGALTGNAATATTLATARTLWGQSFNGSANVTGNLTSVGNITGSGAITIASGGTSTGVTINTAGTGSIILDTGTAGGTVQLKGGASGTRIYNAANTFYTSINVEALTTNRTLTLANGATTLVSGTMVPTGGTGATGTWGISVTGNAATVTNGVYTNNNQTIGGEKTFNGEIRAFQDIGDGTPATRIRFGRDTTQYTTFYSNASGNRLQSVSTSANPKNFQIRVTDTVSTGIFTFALDGALSAGTFNATSTTDGGFQGIATDSAAAPSFTWTGDTNTGIFRPTTDVLAVTTAGAERMRVDASGTVLIGKTSSDDTTVGTRVIQSGLVSIARDGNASLILNRLTSDGTTASFRRSGTQVGTISVTTTNTAYNTSSDYRLKENVVDLSGAIDRLNRLAVYRFNFIADPDKTVDGFIAHEAAEVIPECVTGAKDEVDEDGNPVYQGIDQSKIVPLLTAALQEAVAKIETLEQRLAAAGID